MFTVKIKLTNEMMAKTLSEKMKYFFVDEYLCRGLPEITNDLNNRKLFVGKIPPDYNSLDLHNHF